MTCKGLSFFVLMLAVSLRARLVLSQCLANFDAEPTNAGSPLSCNVLGATVVLNCRIDSQSYELSYYYSETAPPAGVATATEIVSDGHFVLENDEPLGKRGLILTINDFGDDDYGYYWCIVTRTIGTVPSGVNGPSQAVGITDQYTLEQLPTCSDPIQLHSDATRCARAPSNISDDYVIARLDFTDIITMPPPPPPETTAMDTITMEAEPAVSTTMMVPELKLETEPETEPEPETEQNQNLRQNR